jgi:transcriptional regulator with XRE-family HTH domain
LLYFCRVPKLPERQIISSKVIGALRAERLKQNLSMNVLAQKAGLHVSMVSLIEREMRKPTLDVFLRISEALGVDLWKILKSATEKARRD